MWLLLVIELISIIGTSLLIFIFGLCDNCLCYDFFGNGSFKPSYMHNGEVSRGRVCSYGYWH